MKTTVSLEIAKLLTENGFNETTSYFYVKLRSRVYSVDEHGRYYPIKNIPGKLYKSGVNAVLKEGNIYLAPTISEVLCWLYEKRGVWISVDMVFGEDQTGFYYIIRESNPNDDGFMSEEYDTSTAAYEAAILHVLKLKLK